VALNPRGLRAKNGSRTRHETINGDVNFFDCLKAAWCHDRQLQEHVFGAAVVLTQLAYCTMLMNTTPTMSLVEAIDGVEQNDKAKWHGKPKQDLLLFLYFEFLGQRDR